ncbi:MAG: lamin tail domain-containing protein [Chitinophagales bacterium]|nr:lamin tail domain-containing protein [Chitinophagales bacterium]
MRLLFLFLFSISFSTLFSQIEVSEINFNSDSTLNSGNWVEFHNRGSNPVNLTSWLFTDANSFNVFSFPVNQTIAAGGYLVVTDDTAKFKNVNPAVSNVIGEMSFGLSNNSDTITIYDNNGSVVYNMTYFDSTPWQKTADGMGRTLELRTPGADPTLPESWFAGCIGGSPGTAYVPCNDPIIFSELNYNSVLQINSGDWVELHNTTAAPIDISNWELKDKRDTNVYIYPAGTLIPANGYLVTAVDTTLFKSAFPNVLNYVGQLDYSFSNAGDGIRLFNAQTGKIQLSLVFNDKAPWPAGADGQGYTMELIDENGILNDGNNWQDGCLGGSPGKAYDPNCGTGIEETESNVFDLTVVNDGMTSEIVFASDLFLNEKSTLQIFDITGKLVKEMLPRGERQRISREYFSSGVYIARAVSDGAVVSRKFLLK